MIDDRLIICCGNARSGSTMQYDLVCQLLEHNDIAFEPLGFIELKDALRRKRKEGRTYVLKDHHPDFSLMRPYDLVISIVRCEAYVRVSLKNFDGFKNQFPDDVLQKDLEKTRALCEMMALNRNTLVQTYGDEPDDLMTQIADWLGVDKLPEPPENLHATISRSGLRTIAAQSVRFVPKPLRRLVPLGLRHSIRDVLLGISKRDLFHAKHITGTDQLELACTPKYCSLCEFRKNSLN